MLFYALIRLIVNQTAQMIRYTTLIKKKKIYINLSFSRTTIIKFHFDSCLLTEYFLIDMPANSTAHEKKENARRKRRYNKQEKRIKELEYYFILHSFYTHKRGNFGNILNVGNILSSLFIMFFFYICFSWVAQPLPYTQNILFSYVPFIHA